MFMGGAIAAAPADALLASLKQQGDPIDRHTLLGFDRQFALHRPTGTDCLNRKGAYDFAEDPAGQKLADKPIDESDQWKQQEDQRERPGDRQPDHKGDQEGERDESDDGSHHAFHFRHLLGEPRSRALDGGPHHEVNRRFGIEPPRNLGARIDVVIDVQIVTVVAGRPRGDW